MRIYFASDIHGSTTCFRKLVNAGRFYKVDYLIMGGDLSGKQLVPIVGAASGWRSSFRGNTVELRSDEDVAAFEKHLAGVGCYTLRTSDEFVERLRADQSLVESTLHELITARTREWVTFASERLEGSGIQLYLGLGNDDFGDLVPYLDQDSVHYASEGVVPLEDFSLASCGWSNLTPWHTNRELSEQDLAARIAELTEKTEPDRTIFNIHVPPYDSGLDSAARLDENLQIQLVGGQPDMVPVGSTAVRDAIADFQPLLSMHGHIHEGRGVLKLGRSTVVNPGSEYSEAALLGVLLEVKPGQVKKCQLVAG